MSYELSWLVEKRVTLARFSGTITAEEIQSFMTEQHALIAEGIPLVHHINNTTETDKIEAKLGTLQAMMKMFKQPEGLGWHLEVNPRPVSRMMASLSLQFAGARYKVFSTVDEAIAFLQENDTTLPPIKAPE